MFTNLTGQCVYDTFAQVAGARGEEWEEVSSEARAIYDEAAHVLNERLGLCESCGQRPADGDLYEVAGEQYCLACITPPPDPNRTEMLFILDHEHETAECVLVPGNWELLAHEEQNTSGV